MSTSTPNPTLPEVWAPLDVSSGERVERDFGPLRLSVARARGEWIVERDYVGATRPDGPRPYPNDEKVRFVAETEATDLVRLAPVISPRSIVARPELPVWVLAGQETRIFVSTPLWVRLGVGESDDLLEEVPTVVLKDTWFGADTRVGELCYASKTLARVHLADAMRSPVRAITIIRIVNRNKKHFQVQRVKIPAPYLGLYVTEEGTFFTEEVYVLNAADGETGEAKVRSLPVEAGKAKLVRRARESGRVGVFGSLGALLG